MPEQAEPINVNACLLDDGLRVKEASTTLWQAMLEFDGGVDHNGEIHKGLRNEYQDLYDHELIQLEDDWPADKKLPAAEGRAARARERVAKKDPELVAHYRAKDAQITALKQMISNRKASIGAWQSILRGERD